MGYSFRLTARVILYASSHRQDNTYHGLCSTSRGALAGTRNSSMGPPHEGSIRRPIAPWANALTTELHLARHGVRQYRVHRAERQLPPYASSHRTLRQHVPTGADTNMRWFRQCAPPAAYSYRRRLWRRYPARPPTNREIAIFSASSKKPVKMKDPHFEVTFSSLRVIQL